MRRPPEHLQLGAIVGSSASPHEFTIEAGGVVVNFENDVGGVFQACIMTVGSTITPIASSNIYDVMAGLGGCTNLSNASYTGLATTQAQVNADDTLVFMITSCGNRFYGDFQYPSVSG